MLLLFACSMPRVDGYTPPEDATPQVAAEEPSAVPSAALVEVVHPAGAMDHLLEVTPGQVQLQNIALAKDRIVVKGIGADAPSVVALSKRLEQWESVRDFRLGPVQSVPEGQSFEMSFAWDLATNIDPIGIPQEADISGVLSGVNTLANQVGATIDGFHPKSMEAGAPNATPISITLLGATPSLREVLRGLEQWKRVVSIRSMEMTPKGGQMRLSLTIVVFHHN